MKKYVSGQDILGWLLISLLLIGGWLVFAGFIYLFRGDEDISVGFSWFMIVTGVILLSIAVIVRKVIFKLEAEEDERNLRQRQLKEQAEQDEINRRLRAQKEREGLKS